MTIDTKRSYHHSLILLPLAIIYIGPIHTTSPLAPDSPDKFKAEAFENEKIQPTATQLTVGNNNHDGICDSLDFCISGKEMIPSNILMVRNILP